MSAPSIPIDSDLPPNGKNIFYVLEVDGIWKTTDLTVAGKATWTEVYTDVNFEADNEITNSEFLRIIAPTETLVYVLAVAKNIIGNYRPYILRSQNGGLTWSSWIVDDENLTAKNYTVFHYGPQTKTIDDANAAMFDFTIVRPSDANTYSPWGIGTYLSSSDGSGWNELDTDAATVQLTAESNNMTGTVGIGNNLLPGGHADAEVIFNDYFGVGGWHLPPWDHDMPKDAARTHIKFGFGSHGTPGQTATAECWTFWNIPSVVIPKALAVAPTNNSWLYVGLSQKIRGSEDGGETWFDFTPSAAGNGANDICVDPQLAGAIYIWSDTGKLDLWMKTTLGHAGIKKQSALMSETADSNFLRIARDINSGKLWAIPSGATITKRENASNTNQKTGLSSARGLHAYIGGYLICCEASDIYISNDYGITWTAKKGGWTAYNNGINGHRIKS